MIALFSIVVATSYAGIASASPDIVTAAELQLEEDVGPAHGLTPPAIEYKANGKPSHTGPTVCVVELVDTIPEAPGALAYHDERADGTKYIRVGVKTCAAQPGFALLTGPNSLLATITHEIIEATLNPSVDRWVDRKDGNDEALEGCDRVEDVVYTKTLPNGKVVTVTNFLYPAAFDPQASPSERLDHVGALTAQDGLTPGGYVIVRTEPGKVTEDFAKEHARHSRHVVHLGIMSGLVLSVVFGERYPAHKKQAKLDKVRLKYGLAEIAPVTRAAEPKPKSFVELEERVVAAVRALPSYASRADNVNAVRDAFSRAWAELA